MGRLKRLWFTFALLLVSFLSLPGTASATHNLRVVDGASKFNPAFLILSVAPYFLVGIVALVIFREYRRQ